MPRFGGQLETDAVPNPAGSPHEVEPPCVLRRNPSLSLPENRPRVSTCPLSSYPWLQQRTLERSRRPLVALTAAVRSIVERQLRRWWWTWTCQRVMRLYGLALPVRGRRRHGRRHDGQVECMISNQRWCSDVLEIACWNGAVVHLAFALDCCDREVPAHVETPYPTTGAEIRRLIRKTVFARFGPTKPEVPVEGLSDNEGIYTALETVIEAERHHLVPVTTPVASPESNGMAEAFVNTFKRDYVAGGDLASATRVIEQIPGWIEDYNTFAPHSSLGMKSPAEYKHEQQTVADTGCLTK